MICGPNHKYYAPISLHDPLGRFGRLDQNFRTSNMGASLMTSTATNKIEKWGGRSGPMKPGMTVGQRSKGGGRSNILTGTPLYFYLFLPDGQ